MLSQDDDWPAVAVMPALHKDEVHVWRVSLDLDAARLTEARNLLSADELARADRYKVEHARRNFTACRAALRLVLGQYLNCPPRQIVFHYGDNGKPELLQDGPADGTLSFNASHSGAWGLVAIAATGRLGVDIEQCRPLRDMDQLAQTSFSAAELASYDAADADRKIEVFYNGWTRKEAFIKATGKGLAFGLRNFDVELTPGATPRLLRIAGDDTPASQWSLVALTPAEGYAGAVAIDAPDISLACFTTT